MIWGIISAVVASHILGFLWYGPVLFGDVWLKHTFPGKNIAVLQKESHTFEMSVTFVASIVMRVLLFNILNYMFALKNIVTTLKMALLLSGFLTASQVCHHSYASRPAVLFFIELGFDSAVILVSSLCFAYFA